MSTQKKSFLLVSGQNENNQLTCNPKKRSNHNSSICPPCQSKLDLSELLSFSIFSDRSIYVKKNGKAYASGKGDKITKNYEGDCIDKEVNIYKKGKTVEFLSAVCGFFYNLYLSPMPDGCNELIYVNYEKFDSPKGLDIGDHQPIALFGGGYNAAAIDDEGSILPIIDSQINQANLKIKGISLPRCEKAISVACCNSNFFSLGETGKVFYLYIDNKLEFYEVEELKNKKIIHISGTDNTCYAVCNDGNVYMSNMVDSTDYSDSTSYDSSDSISSSNGGLMFSRFTVLEQLSKYKITAAFAGVDHSLFQTNDGKILSMGVNLDGELLLQDFGDIIDSPIETCIKSGALFCIAGFELSAVFFGNVPPNTPNQKLRCDDCRFSAQKIQEKKEKLIKKENKHLKSKIHALKRENETAYIALQEISEINGGNNREIESLENENESLSRQIDHLTKLVSTYEKKLRGANMIIQQKNEIIEKLRELDQEKDESIKYLKKFNQDKDETIEKLKKFNKDKDETILKLKIYNQDKDNTIKKLEILVETKDETFKKLNELNEVLQSRLEATEALSKLEHNSDSNKFTDKSIKLDKNQSLNKPEEMYNFICGGDEDENFENLGEVGRGATSIAYKIIDKRTSKVMCKKIVSQVNDEEKFRKLQNAMKEFETLVRMNHPCICRVIGYNLQEKLFQDINDSDEKTTVAIFIEYLPFKLQEYVTNKKIMNNTLKTKIALEIAFGMMYIHKNGIIHRDLKLENVMLNSIFEAKIIDFDQCHVKDDQELDESKTKGIGTLPYMSPEMLNKEDYNNSTDVYSYGIALYKLFTGRLPEQSMKDKMDKKQIRFPQPSQLISENCIELIKMCTLYDKTKRPSFEKIIEYMYSKDFLLASEIDVEIIKNRYQVLSQFDYKINLKQDNLKQMNQSKNEKKTTQIIQKSNILQKPIIKKLKL